MIDEAIVLAGGLGTRLRSVVADVPKPMAPIAERPFLAFVLERLAAAGVARVVLSIGHRGETIRRHFGQRFGRLDIRYATEDVPLGTGGAMLNALMCVEGRGAFALNGDTLVDADLGGLAKRFAETRADVVMCVAWVPDATRYGMVHLAEDGRVRGFGEKVAGGPGAINAGVYVIERGLFDAVGVSTPFSFEHDVLEPHADRLRLYGVLTHGVFIDIGIPEDYARAQRELARPANR